MRIWKASDDGRFVLVYFSASVSSEYSIAERRLVEKAWPASWHVALFGSHVYTRYVEPGVRVLLRLPFSHQLDVKWRCGYCAKGTSVTLERRFKGIDGETRNITVNIGYAIRYALRRLAGTANMRHAA